MNSFVTRLLRASTLALFAALLLLGAVRAEAQVDPLWDHYTVYTTTATPAPFFSSVTLLDQFGQSTHQVGNLRRFANPVSKTHGPNFFGINKPQLHYTWWSIEPQAFSKDVIAFNQFGDQVIHVDEALFLLNPALKNAPAGFPLPHENHYKCYACTGSAPGVQVQLSDQFWTRTAVVGLPRYFCTPVDKRTPDGQTDLMVNPRLHYTVYDIIEASPTTFSATIRDQFIPDTFSGFPFNPWIMVPTDKGFPTDTKTSTWGRIKSMYR